MWFSYIDTARLLYQTYECCSMCTWKGTRRLATPQDLLEPQPAPNVTKVSVASPLVRCTCAYIVMIIHIKQTWILYCVECAHTRLESLGSTVYARQALGPPENPVARMSTIQLAKQGRGEAAGRQKDIAYISCNSGQKRSVQRAQVTSSISILQPSSRCFENRRNRSGTRQTPLLSDLILWIYCRCCRVDITQSISASAESGVPGTQ